MKKFDTLYWKAFGAWFTCFTLLYGSMADAIFAIGIVASGGSLLSAKALVMGVMGVLFAILPAVATTGWWMLSYEVRGIHEPLRTLALCESAKQGWRMTLLLNPPGWVVLLVVLPLWRYVLEPVWGCVGFAVHNVSTVDDGPRRQPLTEPEKQVYAIGAVVVLFALAVIIKYHFFGH